MSNKKIGFYFEDQLPNISTPLIDDFSFFYIKNEESFNGEIVNIPKLFLYNKNINNFINLSGPDNYYVNSVNNIISNNGNIDLNLQNIVDKDNSINKEIKFINGNYLYSKNDVSYFSNLSNTQINNFNNLTNTIIIGKNFGNINYELISDNNIFLGNNIKLPNNILTDNLILTNDLNISLNNYQINNNTFIGGYFYSENTEEFINQQIISGNIFIKGLGFGNISENFKFNLPLSLSNNTKIIDIDNNNENDSLLYENILVSKNNGLIGIKRINSFDFVPTLSQVLVKSGSPNTINIENINLENLKFTNFVNNESQTLDNKIGYLIIDNVGKIFWKQLENKPTLESVINENPNANTKPIFNEVEITNKLYVKNLSNKNNDILFDKIIITDSNGELAQISKNDLSNSIKNSFIELDSTVPNYVKNITQQDINKWNNSNPKGFISTTYDSLLLTKNNGQLLPNTWYKVTGIMSEYYPDYNIVSWHYSIDNNTLSEDAFALLPVTSDVIPTIIYFKKGTITGTLNDVSSGWSTIVVSNTGKEFYYLFNGAIKIKDSISLTELAQCNTFTDKYDSNNYISGVSLNLTEYTSYSYMFNTNYVWSYYGRNYKLLSDGFIPGEDINDSTKLDSNYALDITFTMENGLEINKIKYDLNSNKIFGREDNNNNKIEISKEQLQNSNAFAPILMGYKFTFKNYYNHSNNNAFISDMSKRIILSNSNLGFKNNYFKNCYINWTGYSIYNSNPKFINNKITDSSIILGLAGNDLNFTGNNLKNCQIYCVGGLFANNWFGNNELITTTFKNVNGLRFFSNKVLDSQILNYETNLSYTYFTNNIIDKSVLKDLNISSANGAYNHQLYFQHNTFINSNVNNIIKTNVATNGIINIKNKKFNNFNISNSQNNFTPIINNWNSSTHFFNDYNVEFLTSYNGLLKLSKIVDNGLQILDYNS